MSEEVAHLDESVLDVAEALVQVSADFVDPSLRATTFRPSLRSG